MGTSPMLWCSEAPTAALGKGPPAPLADPEPESESEPESEPDCDIGEPSPFARSLLLAGGVEGGEVTPPPCRPSPRGRDCPFAHPRGFDVLMSTASCDGGGGRSRWKRHGGESRHRWVCVCVCVSPTHTRAWWRDGRGDTVVPTVVPTHGRGDTWWWRHMVVATHSRGDTQQAKRARQATGSGG